MPKPFNLEQLVSIPNVWGYDLSPDGQSAAVVWDKSGQFEIYLLALEGRSKPVQITSGPESKVAPKFSPDGAWLVFAQDYAGDENFDLFIYDRQTGETRNLTPGTPDETINPEVAWSPDGRELAFTSNREGTFATYILNLPSGHVRRVTHHPYS
ncbi:MAG: TolB family protein, partial [Anaerolineales bacterium]